MEKIEWLYVKNIISREKKQAQQQLHFFLRVENINYDKKIDIIWSGEEGTWHTLPAQYHSMQGNGNEYWQADICITLTETQSLPGNIQFELRYRIYNDEYYDNNHGQYYQSQADSGVKLAAHRLIQNIEFLPQLSEQQATTPITVAVNAPFKAKQVIIHWTTNDWKTTHKTPCQLSQNHWDTDKKSNARNPNQYGVELWQGIINAADAFQLQYSVCCKNNQQTLWDNNFDNNYQLQHAQLNVLILNLHCYQEENQDEKFSQIAHAINELDADIICFQEVAEYWRDGEGDWESNAAKLINDRLKKPFHLHTDWSHLGFDQYREGVAILSRYPLTQQQSRYVSESEDIYSIHSRKVVMAQVHVPYMGIINVFSAHLSWLEDGFEAQFEQLQHWATSLQTNNTQATLLCGDFNITAGSKGYQLVVESNAYDDQYLAANKHGIFESIFKVNDAHWQNLLTEDYRIDYIFMNKGSALQVTSAKVIFTEQDYGVVSDHCGYFMSFKPKGE